MVDPAPAVGEPALSRRSRITGVAVGALTLTAGGVAVFVTDNELGSTALVTAGVVIAGLAVFGNRIEAVEAAGVRLELERQARRVRKQAQLARVAGEVDRAEELEDRARSLLAAATAVGSRYERIREKEPSGWDRTARMEGALRTVRALDTEGLSGADVARIFATGTDGNRIVALALLESSPHLATADVLVEGIRDSRSTFEQYHALTATELALDHLSPQDRARVREAVEQVLAGPLGERSSDRRTVARRLVQALGRGDGA